ncbi:tRNA (N6-isopentenyl adenosine(37)-C2)-methylthiotransferase MiaB [candidate division KSB1 bacterium]|nr:tRNA (N6-isopentenyl adenosine(37)-C2)-methylthiotransferase MiaB [candidate division KSB1 bacterium]
MKAQNTTMQPSFFIETYGCQMNKYDSELIAGLLECHGHMQTTNPDQADTIIVNTCSVRDHAEQRALGRIRSLSAWKKGKKHRRLGVIGCMSQRLGKEILASCPAVDFVLGPDEYGILPRILENGKSMPVVRTRSNDQENYSWIHPQRAPGVHGWIAIMRGCNNYCSYCIVPYTRGRERSRSAIEIISEFENMSARGFREITLLGQNVNSYQDTDHSFHDLLKQLAGIDRDIWIRFTTSHPKDISDQLLEVIANEPNVCPHLHLPVQSGSNRVLERMNRKYTKEHYLALVKKAQKKIPNLALTTDVMMGFPGETDTDFLETVHLMETVRFDDAFMYHYSPREGTKSAQMKETLSQEQKLARLNQVIELQRHITADIKSGMIGQTVDVMLESPSKQNPKEWMGKTPNNHIVVVQGKSGPSGEVIKVKIVELKGITLRGCVID